jgi:hypothetical protein
VVEVEVAGMPQDKVETAVEDQVDLGEERAVNQVVMLVLVILHQYLHHKEILVVLVWPPTPLKAELEEVGELAVPEALTLLLPLVVPVV